MKISASGEYAVRILVEIAKSENYVSLKDVASKLDISLKFAEKIVSKFVKEGFLSSLRGQDGGYKLSKKPSEISIKDVLLLTGDVKPLSPCLEADCPHKDSCTSISVWEKLNGLINNYLNGVTLNDLIDEKKAV